MLAIIEGSVSVLKKKWKRLRHESRRPHFAFVPLRKARDEDNDAAFAPRQEVSRKVNDEVENPHEFTLFSFLTKSHNLILDTALCVESREQVILCFVFYVYSKEDVRQRSSLNFVVDF